MNQLLAAFGIDWRLLLINGVNFGVLLFVLWYFLYEPLTTMLETRRQKVAQGVKDAEDAAQKLQEIEGTRSHVLAEAGKEADSIVSHARNTATAKEREIIAAGEQAAQSIVKDAEAQAGELKNQAIEESKQEVAKLIVLGMEKAMKK